MSDNPCQHTVLDDLRVARCRAHGRPAVGVEVWVWSTGPLPPLRGACTAGDRFVVATDEADAEWRWSADVVLGASQSTAPGALSVAEMLDRLPGCALIAAPAGQARTVFRTRTHHIVIASDRACGVCLHPWLAIGARFGGTGRGGAMSPRVGGLPRNPVVVGLG